MYIEGPVTAGYQGHPAHRHSGGVSNTGGFQERLAIHPDGTFHTDKDWNDLPHITITYPNEWIPTSLDSSISEEWYRNQDRDLDLLQQGILSETGDLKPDLEDNEDNED